MKENGTVTTMQQVEEAVTRMRLLGCPQQIVHAFEDCRLVCICIPPDNRYLPTGDEVLERVHAFEEKYHAVVYSVIRSTTALGLMDSYLFVSDETDDWEMDRVGLETGLACAYVYSYDDPNCSEFGSIGIGRTDFGGLMRTW